MDNDEDRSGEMLGKRTNDAADRVEPSSGSADHDDVTLHMPRHNDVRDY